MMDGEREYRDPCFRTDLILNAFSGIPAIWVLVRDVLLPKRFNKIMADIGIIVPDSYGYGAKLGYVFMDSYLKALNPAQPSEPENPLYPQPMNFPLNEEILCRVSFVLVAYTCGMW